MTQNLQETCVEAGNVAGSPQGLKQISWGAAAQEKSYSKNVAQFDSYGSSQ